MQVIFHDPKILSRKILNFFSKKIKIFWEWFTNNVSLDILFLRTFVINANTSILYRCCANKLTRKKQVLWGTAPEWWSEFKNFAHHRCRKKGTDNWMHLNKRSNQGVKLPCGSKYGIHSVEHQTLISFECLQIKPYN
jgi:hypothetical protein